MHIPYSGKFSGGGGGGVIFSWISIINHIRGKQIVVSESIIANHACTSLVRG